MRSIFVATVLVFWCNVTAQQTEDELMILLEALYEDFPEVEADSYWSERLRTIHENPIDINHTSREQLQELPFLSNMQIENLQYYIYEFGPITSLYELKAVEGLDQRTIRFLYPFLALESHGNTSEEVPRKGRIKNELILRTTKILEVQDGFKDGEAQGNSFSHLVKHKINYNNFSWFATLEKDIGERYWNMGQPEFVSSVVQYNGTGIVRSIFVGDFKVQLGQGISQASDMFGRKSAMVLNTRKSGNTLRRSTSADGMMFKRGVGVTLSKDRWEATVYGSRQKLDATLYDDTLRGISYFKSYSNGGLHRTVTEYSKRNNLIMSETGANIQYSHRLFRLAIYGNAIKHDKWMKRDTSFYSHWGNAGFSGFGTAGKIHWWFDSSTDWQNNFATLAGVDLFPDKALGLSVVGRNYSKDYYSYGGFAFGEGSAPSNEQGVYIGLQLLPWKDFVLSSYLDFFRFPAATYHAISPSSGWEGLVQLNGQIVENVDFTSRLKYEVKDKDITSDAIPKMLQSRKIDAHVHLTYDLQPLVLKSRIQMTKVDFAGNSEVGWLVLQDFHFSAWRNQLKNALRVAFFHTPSYNSRLYAYESDVLYAFSVPAYYGQGMRMYLNASVTPFSGMIIYFKIGRTLYFDREEISSGFSGISENHKSEVKLQVRYKF